MNSVDYRGNNHSLFAIIATGQRSGKVVALIAARTLLPNTRQGWRWKARIIATQKNFPDANDSMEIAMQQYFWRSPRSDRAERQKERQRAMRERLWTCIPASHCYQSINPV
jgi:hypothetical protein